MIDDEAPRRRGASRVDAPENAPERGFLLRLLMRNPKDVVAGAVAATAAIAIIANAAFMQAGRHPAPMFSAIFPDAAPQPAASSVSVAAAPAGMVTGSGPLPRPRPSEADAHESRANEAASAPMVKTAVVAAPQANAVPRPPAPIPPHADPVGDLIASTRRVTSVQRILTEFGYGQLKPTGVAGPETRAAVERFERDRKLPVTGQITERLARELAAATGRPVE